MNYHKTIRFLIKFSIICLVILLIVAGFLFLGYLQSLPTKETKQECQIAEQRYQNRTVYVITPKDGKKVDTVIFYIHGGSYMGNLVKEHWDFFRDIVNEIGCTIIVPDYPLAPQYQYQDVFDFIEPLYQEVEQKIEKKNLILMGDSAGGGLSLALAQKLGEQGSKQPAKLILLSPWLDVTMSNPKIKEVEKQDKILNIFSLKAAGVAYAGKDGMNSYLVNPIKGPLDKLEKVVILTGTQDILNPDVHVLTQRAKRQGISIALKETKGAEHVWMLGRHTNKYQAEEGYQQVIQEIKEVSQN